ncbi:MAG: Gfo/Idh/MocA family oxidoreductase [Candidatus Cloacimonetes bacterium]|nr:Gfo/Idh/MocA family oxidoreductase [Candidatus Cloacimonadota bacterium]
MARFALMGAAGYIAPKHLQAIRDIEGDLVAAFDPCDSVGILDSYFPNTQFFVEFERFDRFIDKISLNDYSRVDHISICSPNYLHDSHIRFALKSGANAICEKPLVLNPHNLIPLQRLEKETNQKIFCILQLRFHSAIVRLKETITAKLLQNPDKVFEVDLTYLTSRGPWYSISWKGDPSKSGGISTNIGIHFFDVLIWIFGEVIDSEVHCHSMSTGTGFVRLKNANVRWFLSIDSTYLENKKTFRNICVDGEDLEFSTGFDDLHTRNYIEILKGNGAGLDDVSPAISLVSKIRNSKLINISQNRHFLYNRLSNV